ncbi:MAG TPA: methyltransferase domain-containing protein [Myxococcota bacterium]|nr:methyltransferase domain-containing protein [Myxococcota bacterium]
MALDPLTLTEPTLERAVHARYTMAARTEAALCCPVSYDPRYLEVIPAEVLERDYGRGDPSRYVREGDVVLDPGSGGGKICFIAAQIAGPKGRMIGVDVNEEMLDLARHAAPLVAEKVRFANVEFRRGRIQDLALNLDRLDTWLAEHPVRNAADLSALETTREQLHRQTPLVADASIDLVVSNCVLNLVRDEDKPRLVREIFRVLKVGGRIAISDIVSDEPLPRHLKDDPKLWSGCIAGAFHELELLRELEAAGFYGIAIEKWEHEPFAVIDGVEFRATTLTARKGKEGPGYEANEAVIYAGPWKRVEDDDGHVLERGVRTAVCAKTYCILTSALYAGETIGVSPRAMIPEPERTVFDCSHTAPRGPRETKGLEYREIREPCAGGNCC